MDKVEWVDYEKKNIFHRGLAEISFHSMYNKRLTETVYERLQEKNKFARVRDFLMYLDFFK